MKPRATLAFLVLALGCAGSVPATTRYLLPAEVPEGTARLSPPREVGLGRVVVAPYLQEEGLVVETEAHQVRHARFHVWAEPLEDGLRRFLRIEISRALGVDLAVDPAGQASWQRVVDVSVDRLHGTLTGQAVLTARWRITSAGEEPRDFRFSATLPLEREGYAGLVDAEIALARRLAGEIADSLRR